jgi:hypothetical protein
VFCLDVVVVCRYISSSDMFLCSSSWSCIGVLHILWHLGICCVFSLYVFLVFGRTVVSCMYVMIVKLMLGNLVSYFWHLE